MDWLSKNYDRAILIAVSAIAIIVSALLAMKSLAFGAAFAGAGDTKPGETVPETGEELVVKLQEKVAAEHAWTRKEYEGYALPLLASVPIVEDEAGVIRNMLDPKSEPIRDEVPNPWLVAHRLDYTRSDVLSLDKDGDGFTNLEEWNGKTDPTDPTSHPEPITQLYLGSIGEDPYILRYAALIDPQFQVIRIEPEPRRSWFKAVGDTFPDQGDEAGRFEILEHNAKTDAAGRDVSELVVKDNVRTADSPFVLRKGDETPRPILFANFIYKHGGTPEPIERVDIGGTFTIPGGDSPVITLKSLHADEGYAIVSFTPEGSSAPREMRIPLDNG